MPGTSVIIPAVRAEGRRATRRAVTWSVSRAQPRVARDEGAILRLTSAAEIRPEATSPASSRARCARPRAKGWWRASASGSASAPAAARAVAPSSGLPVASKTHAISVSRRAQSRRAAGVSSRSTTRSTIAAWRSALIWSETTRRLWRLEELEGVGLHGLGIEEPARRLRKVEQLGAARDARGVHRRRRGRRRRDARVLEEAPPARERGGRRRAVVAVERQRLGAERERARRIRLDPRQLLGGAQRLELALEPLLRDVAARRVHDADGVVDDQRAEARAAEAALEEHPRGARAAAVDAREPGARGPLRAGLDDGSTPGAGRRRDAAL